MHLAGQGMREIARELGLPDHKYVCRWVKAYQDKGWDGLKTQRGRNAGIHLGVISSRKAELRIKWLEAEVALLKKITAWERRDVRKKYCSPLSEN
jgi:hypothetical protein